MVCQLGNSWGQTMEDLKIRALDGDAFSQLQLGFHFSKGAQKDEREALYWMTKAARQDSILACRFLGLSYMEGCGTSKNLLLARKWFEKGAIQADNLSMIGLADCLLTSDERIKATAWLILAKERGEQNARWRLDQIIPTLDPQEKTEALEESRRLKKAITRPNEQPLAKAPQLKKRKFTLSDGSTYHGENIGGIPHGFGEKTTPTGQKYQGTFINGFENGFGILFSSAGLITYQGLWLNGSPTKQVRGQAKNQGRDE